MGSLYKQKIVRYLDANGRRVPAGTPGARKVVAKSRKWYGKYRIPGGPERRVPLAVDKQVARSKLTKLERKAERQDEGFEDEATRAARLPLAAHVKQWLKALADNGTSQRRIDDLVGRIGKFIAAAGWVKLADMTAASASDVLARMAIGVQTRNHYIQHVKQLARWLTDNRRLPVNPLASLKGGNVRTDRRHDRRELTADEQARLIRTAEASAKVNYKLDGPSRALLYELAFATGFRRNELRSLTRDSFDLDTGFVTVAAGYSKRRRQDTQPLPVALVGRLRAWFAAGKGLWPELTHHTARMFKVDLEAAGIPYVTQGPDGPLYADFHSARHSFVSAICRTDAPLKDLVELARHSDPKLTLKTYAHAKLLDKARVVAKLPDPRAEPQPAVDQQQAKPA